MKINPKPGKSELPPFTAGELQARYFAYADDILMACKDLPEAQLKLNRIDKKAIPAGLLINPNKGKTELLQICSSPPVAAGELEDFTEEEIKRLPFPCQFCGRRFPSKRGKQIHIGKWCTGDPRERSIKGSKAAEFLIAKRNEANRAEQREAENLHVMLKGVQILIVENVVYLGSKINCVGGWKADFDRRKGIAFQKFGVMRGVLTAGQMPREMRVVVFLITISTILLYGSECWIAGPEAVLREIRAVNSSFAWALTLRRKKAEDFKSEKNKKTMEIFSNMINLPALFIRRKLKWLGNLLHAEVDTPSRDVVAKMPEMVEKWFFGLSVEEAREKSANFIEWDEFIDECVAKHGLTSEKINAEKKKKENE
jgi:hypothetical protein